MSAVAKGLPKLWLLHICGNMVVIDSNFNTSEYLKIAHVSCILSIVETHFSISFGVLGVIHERKRPYKEAVN